MLQVSDWLNAGLCFSASVLHLCLINPEVTHTQRHTHLSTQHKTKYPQNKKNSQEVKLNDQWMLFPCCIKMSVSKPRVHLFLNYNRRVFLFILMFKLSDCSLHVTMCNVQTCFHLYRPLVCPQSHLLKDGCVIFSVNGENDTNMKLK